MLLLQLLPLAQFACQWAPIRLWQPARTSLWVVLLAGGRSSAATFSGWPSIRTFPYVGVLLAQRKTERRQFVVVTLHLASAMRVLYSFNHKNVNHKALMPRPLLCSTLHIALLNLITQVAGEKAKWLLPHVKYKIYSQHSDICILLWFACCARTQKLTHTHP